MIKYILIFFFFLNSLNALEIRCKFEEVYSNGDHQTGFFLYKNNMLRYQYYSSDLFTLFYNKNFYLVKNNDKSLIQKLNDKNNVEILNELLDIANKYPDINLKYQKNDMFISLEKSVLNNFYKRISINSDKLNISIYLNECDFINIKDRFFIHNPFYEYNFK